MYAIMLCGLFLVAAAGCTDETRHKILTFFFEGVPPIGGEITSEETVRTPDDPLKPAAEEKEPVSRRSKQSHSTKHEPVSDCNKCHIGGMNSGRRELVEAMPYLCYSCHTNYHEAGAYLHGPVSVGDCVFCHDPHRSKYIHLQKAPQPKLCYQCHVVADMRSIPGHLQMQDTICTDCHDPHVSSERKLLKHVGGRDEDPNTVN